MKKLLITAIIMLILICVAAGSVQATYQSSPNASAITATQENWAVNIRKMEASGKVMGLNENLQSTETLLPNGTNNIDVHMQKNTEYGAMLILAVSDYGKQGNGTENSDHITDSTYGLATSTGNASGITNFGNIEFVLAGNNSNKYYPVFYKISERYKNSYGETLVSKRGDALDIVTWQGNTAGNWLYEGYLAHREYNRIRIYRNTFHYSSPSAGYDDAVSYYSRACIVNGENF